MAIHQPSRISRRAFLSLQREWYQKLKDSGFIDLEKLLPSGDMADLLSGGGLRSDYTPTVIEARYSYFAKARRFAQYYDRFPSDLHREIWRLYGEGLSMRAIGKRVNRSVGRVHPKIAELMDEFRHWIDPDAEETE